MRTNFALFFLFFALELVSTAPILSYQGTARPSTQPYQGTARPAYQGTARPSTQSTTDPVGTSRAPQPNVLSAGNTPSSGTTTPADTARLNALTPQGKTNPQQLATPPRTPSPNPPPINPSSAAGGQGTTQRTANQQLSASPPTTPPQGNSPPGPAGSGTAQDKTDPQQLATPPSTPPQRGSSPNNAPSRQTNPSSGTASGQSTANPLNQVAGTKRKNYPDQSSQSGDVSSAPPAKVPKTGSQIPAKTDSQIPNYDPNGGLQLQQGGGARPTDGDYNYHQGTFKTPPGWGPADTADALSAQGGHLTQAYKNGDDGLKKKQMPGDLTALHSTDNPNDPNSCGTLCMHTSEKTTTTGADPQKPSYVGAFAKNGYTSKEVTPPPL